MQSLLLVGRKSREHKWERCRRDKETPCRIESFPTALSSNTPGTSFYRRDWFLTSPKNFYRSLRLLTGLTPTAFRKLPPEAVEQLVKSLWAKVKV
jgi:hypothetical protein